MDNFNISGTIQTLLARRRQVAREAHTLDHKLKLVKTSQVATMTTSYMSSYWVVSEEMNQLEVNY